jgi:hypothetical protein
MFYHTGGAQSGGREVKTQLVRQSVKAVCARALNEVPFIYYEKELVSSI